MIPQAALKLTVLSIWMPMGLIIPGLTSADSDSLKTPDTAITDSVKKYDLALDRPWQKVSMCGPNSLYLTAKLLGRPVDYKSVVDSISVDPESGCTLFDLKRVSENYKLGLVARKIQFKEITELPLPFIAHLQRNDLEHKSGHFVVVVDFVPKDGRIIAYDPNSEFKIIFNRENFHRAMSGYVLCPSAEAHYSKLFFYMLLVLNISLFGLLFLSTPEGHFDSFSSSSQLD